MYLESKLGSLSDNQSLCLLVSQSISLSICQPDKAPAPCAIRRIKFENGALALKTNQMFSVHTTVKKSEKATITGHFGSAFEENSGRLSVMSSIPKISFFKVISVHK